MQVYHVLRSGTHPGCWDKRRAENTLLHLAAVDDSGLNYDIAIVAYGIITGNI